MATRFNLSEQDIESTIETDEAYKQKIPILQRRAKPSSAGCEAPNDPICVIVVGMAGSGKTTLMAQLQKSLGLRDADDEAVGDVSASTVHFANHLRLGES